MKEEITDPNLAYRWIKNNYKRLTRSQLLNALDRWLLMAGYTMLMASDIIWCLKNIKNEKEAIDDPIK